MTMLTKIPAAIPRKAEGEVAPLVRVPRGETVRINEIFCSLQGESTRVGLPTVFVRLTGCPLRCGYCDTVYAFHEGSTQSFTDVLARIAAFDTKTVCVTGGEPLAQKNCLRLLTRLCDLGYSVSLETSGAISLEGVDTRVSRILDIKTPGSGEADKNHWTNLALLTAHDEIKFVVTNEADYEWARDLVRDKQLNRLCTVLISPSYGEVEPPQLAQWILRDKPPVRMQLQLHKILWGERRGV